jgi:hypothetical protein
VIAAGSGGPAWYPLLQKPRNCCTIDPDFYQQAQAPMTFARFHFYFYFSYSSPKAEEKR